MNTSKLDLKILDNFILFILLLFTSCQTVTIDNVSVNREDPVYVNPIEFELPELEKVKPITFDTSITFTRPESGPYSEIKSLPLLKYGIFDKPEYSLVLKEVFSREFSLPLLSIIYPKKVEPVVVKKVVIKPSVVENIVIKTPVVIPSKTNSNKKVVVISKPRVTLKNETTKVVQKKIEEPILDIIFLDERDVLVNKSFTIEMDQTGWLYEESLENLHFENKFYTNNKVLFEFVPEESGTYNLNFVKYTVDGAKYSRVKVNALLKTEAITTTKKNFIITPDIVLEGISEKKRLETDLLEIKNKKNPDEIYFKLAEIYFAEGLIKKSKEYYEYVYDNYPLSIYYEDAKDKTEYIINNFLKVR